MGRRFHSFRLRYTASTTGPIAGSSLLHVDPHALLHHESAPACAEQGQRGTGFPPPSAGAAPSEIARVPIPEENPGQPHAGPPDYWNVTTAVRYHGWPLASSTPQNSKYWSPAGNRPAPVSGATIVPFA